MSAAPLVICAPLAGTVVALADVPDEVFAAGMVGPGVAIEPDRSATTAYCPVEGVVSKLHPHAFVIESGPKAVLTHLGIDTVELAGDGFIILAQEGKQTGKQGLSLTMSYSDFFRRIIGSLVI